MLISKHMAKLDQQTIEHIAKLSRLKLKDKEKELYSSQLSSVLSYVEQLQKVDTENVEPLSNVTGLKNIYREDKAEESDIKYNNIEKNAPDFEDGNFVVPPVFK